ncbi:MAG: T9SS type A sorting domain-containing protein [Crocinitomicaceae bacterium]
MNTELNNFKLRKLKLSFLFTLSALISFSQNSFSNSSFEDGIDSYALDWSSYQSITSSVARTSAHAENGSYSLCVWNWYWYLPGFAVNGDILNSGFNDPFKNAGTPFSEVPEFVSGYYMYDTTNTLSNNDSAVVKIALKKYNAESQDIDIVASGITYLPATSISNGFTYFEVAINNLMPGISPDSIVVLLSSSKEGSYCDDSNGQCLYFYIDDLAASRTSGISVNIINPDIKLWPNPIDDNLSIGLSDIQNSFIRVLDLKGILVFEDHIKGEGKFNLASFESGTYLLKFEINGVEKSRKIVKKIISSHANKENLYSFV